jgi:hypothetical protein
METENRNKTGKWVQIVAIAGSLSFFLPNLLYILMGWFVRHRADDFCFSGTFHEFGFIGGLTEFYSMISNRFSAFMLWSFSDLFGEKAIRFIPMLAILFMGIAIYIMIHTIAVRNDLWSSQILSLFSAQILTFFFLYLSPSIHQSVYWRAALVHYFLPVPVLLLMLLFVIRQKPVDKRWFLKLLFFFLSALFMAGLSESYAALQGGAFSILLIAYLFHSSRSQMNHYLNYSVAAILGTLAALLIMIVSPGNALKIATVDQATSIGSVIAISLNSAISFIFYTIRAQWLPFSVLFLLGFLLATIPVPNAPQHFSRIRLARTIALIPIGVFLLIFCISAPTAYGMLAYPEKRVLMLALIVLVMGIFSIGFSLGLLGVSILRPTLRLRMIAIVLVLILSVYPLYSLQSISVMRDFYRSRASLWDQQQEEILKQIASGETDLVVTALDAHAEIAEMRDYSGFWVNLCTAQYYNVDTIIAIER